MWEYIRGGRLEINPLYDMDLPCWSLKSQQGKTAGQSFDYFQPTEGVYKILWEDVWTLSMLAEQRRWKTAEDVFSWWMGERDHRGADEFV